MTVRATSAERRHAGSTDRAVWRPIAQAGIDEERARVEIDSWIRYFVMEAGRNLLVVQAQHRLDETSDPGGLADSMRDLVATTTTTHLTITNNRLNEVMKILTIISTIFMPLSFVAGIYGMNFTYMPELDWRWGYPLVWLIFLGLAGGMIYMFRRRQWF